MSFKSRCDFCGSIIIQSYKDKHPECPLCNKLIPNTGGYKVNKTQKLVAKIRGNFTCVYCGKRERNITIDHLNPISNNGTNNRNNMFPCCEDCNKGKANKNWFDFSRNCFDITKVFNMITEQIQFKINNNKLRDFIISNDCDYTIVTSYLFENHELRESMRDGGQKIQKTS